MDVVLRALVVFVAVFVLTRIIGRRELSTLQPFDLILLVVIGDLVQNGVTQNDLSVTGVLLVIFTIGLLQVATSYVAYRFKWTRPLLQGEPIVLIDNGRIIDRNMHRERLDRADIAEQARLNGIANLADVRWAVLETNGEISFIKND
jgi:uncharacterized membrane protein YcaP (DUF421 family)